MASDHRDRLAEVSCGSTPDPLPTPELGVGPVAEPEQATGATGDATIGGGVAEPYGSSAEHLDDELRRVEFLVRARFERWRASAGGEIWNVGARVEAELAAFADRRFDGRPAPAAGRDGVDSHRLDPHRLDPHRPDDQWLTGAAAHQGCINRRLAATSGVELRIRSLELAFGLQKLDMALVLLCLLPDRDESYRRLYAALSYLDWAPLPSVGLLGQILDPTADDVDQVRPRLMAGCPLIDHCLVSVQVEPGFKGESLSTRMVKLDERIAAYLLGHDHLDPAIAPWVSCEEPMNWSELLPAARARELMPLAGWVRTVTARCADDRDVGQARGGPTVALIGPPGVGRRSAARCIASHVGVPLLSVDVALVDAVGPQGVVMVYREAALRGAAVFWHGCARLAARDADEDHQWAGVLRAAARHPQVTFVDHAQPWDPPDLAVRLGEFIRVPCPPPTIGQRDEIWRTLLQREHWPDGEIASTAALLAPTFQLTPGRMLEAIRMSRDLQVQRRLLPPDPHSPRDGQTGTAVASLIDACRRQASRRIMTFARLVEPPADMVLELPAIGVAPLTTVDPGVGERAGPEGRAEPGEPASPGPPVAAHSVLEPRRWSPRVPAALADPVGPAAATPGSEASGPPLVRTLVLPPDQLAQLLSLRNRIRSRALVEERLGPNRSGPKSLVALFAGSSGTGKTLAASLLAKDLGRDLLRVDLAQVVSKWVGETEKHLDLVFNEAQDAHAVIFFDEADALFGKRGAVTDARDRYANQEVSFLLQRIEDYDGVVILATNLRQNLDEAFLRRIQYVIDFPMPDEAARRRLWNEALATVFVVPDAALISDQLAGRYRLSPAEINTAIADAIASQTDDGSTPDVDRLVEACAAALDRKGLPRLVDRGAPLGDGGATRQ